MGKLLTIDNDNLRNGGKSLQVDLACARILVKKVDYLLSHFHCGKRKAMPRNVIDAFVSWEGRLSLHEKL